MALWELARGVLRAPYGFMSVRGKGTDVSSDTIESEAFSVDRAREAKVRCWEVRGCAGVRGLTDPLIEECPHSRSDCYSPCPIDCVYAARCSRPWHKVSSSPDLLLDVTVDRTAAIKKACQICEHFLTYGPRVGEDGSTANVLPERATAGEGRTTVHFF